MTDEEYCAWVKEYGTAVSQINEIIEKIRTKNEMITI